MVASGNELLGQALDLAKAVRVQINDLPGLSVVERQLLCTEASHDLDRLQLLIDASELGISGYQSADWLRETKAVDVGVSDHRRILATLSMAHDANTTTRLLEALRELTMSAASFPMLSPVELPKPGELELESVLSPREDFFGPREAVPAAKAAGRIAAEQVTPYPPGIPTLVSRERINQAVVDYLRSGLAAGMVIPDATDTMLDTFVVVA